MHSSAIALIRPTVASRPSQRGPRQKKFVHHWYTQISVEHVVKLEIFAHALLFSTGCDKIKLESTGYSALPLPSRLMRRTHTQRDSLTLSVTIPSPLAKRRQRFSVIKRKYQ